MDAGARGDLRNAERFATAARIDDGNLENWHREWYQTTQRVQRDAEISAAGGHTVSARGAYLRAANYYRAAG